MIARTIPPLLALFAVALATFLARDSNREPIIAVAPFLIAICLVGVVVEFWTTLVVVVMSVASLHLIVFHPSERDFGRVESVIATIAIVVVGVTIGFLGRSDRKHRRSLSELQSTIQKLVDERTLESAATNKELSFECAERMKVEAILLLRDRALESLPQGVVITESGAGQRIVYVNDGFLKLTGYDRSEILGSNCRFLQGKDTSKKAIAELRDAVAKGEPCLVEIINYRKDGTPFWNALTIAPIFDDRKRLTHYVGIQIDISHFKRIEAHFQQAQKMEAIGHLASGVAHDFNNLLTIINGCGELLRDEFDSDDPKRNLLEEIVHAGQRAASLTRQLLTFSRKSTIQPQMLDANEVVKNLEKMLSRLIGANIRLSFDLNPISRRVEADPGQLEQVLLNLVVNARDAMPRGGEIAIQTREVELDEVFASTCPGLEAGPHLRITVSDTGSGMDQATLQRVFEPFFTTKPAGKGTGLGLATVYGVVKQCDGYVAVSSEIGRGTTFQIYFPLSRIERSRKSDFDHFPAEMSKATGRETVLLVEDEEGVRNLARQALAINGYRILEASNGIEAIRIAEAMDEKIDILLTDVIMPEMGGRELAERLVVDHPNLRVVFMSGYTDDAMIREGVFDLEMHFLQKPFSVNALLSLIRQVLDESLLESAV